MKAGLSQAGRLWGLKADRLALSQPGEVHSPHPGMRALPDFQILRRLWMVKATLLKTAAAAAIAIAIARLMKGKKKVKLSESELPLLAK